jgi:hypothetical protein
MNTQISSVQTDQRHLSEKARRLLEAHDREVSRTEPSNRSPGAY